ncbi:hypothetical protein ON010_g14417 [Phytophthora cinnamomi]|nr:hypothetical protein ON010_g14417 [Phytophthora cinnamomi]
MSKTHVENVENIGLTILTAYGIVLKLVSGMFVVIMNPCVPVPIPQITAWLEDGRGVEAVDLHIAQLIALAALFIDRHNLTLGCYMLANLFRDLQRAVSVKLQPRSVNVCLLPGDEVAHSE